MKRLTGRMSSIIALIVITIWVGAAVAHAYCPSTLIAESGPDRIVCVSTGEDSQWCYYNCWCKGAQTGCDALYDFVGLVDQ